MCTEENNDNIDNYFDTRHPEATEATTERQFVLLCLDYLRSLRRSHCIPHNDLDIELGLNQDYITIAIWALSNAFSRPPELSHGSINEAEKCLQNPLQFGNDPFFQPQAKHFANVDPTKKNKAVKIGENIFVPALNIMESEILYRASFENSVKSHVGSCYEYEDDHYSNQWRFYKTMGLSNIPLSLHQIVSSGIMTLNARCRLQAEESFMTDELFTNFVEVVTKNGFFNISEQDILHHSDAFIGMNEDRIIEISEKIHEERFRKVVSKFRTKLASKYEDNEKEVLKESVKDDIASDEELQKDVRNDTGDKLESPHVNNIPKLESTQSDNRNNNESLSDAHNAAANEDLHSLDLYDDIPKVSKSSYPSLVSLPSNIDRNDFENAERLKIFGNSAMQQRKYEKAKYYYTRALELVPTGPSSHIYFTNRAAAWLSMRNFPEAIWDAERSTTLKPDYAKAHARLGLAHFLLERYNDAVNSYTLAVKYDPSNSTSASYLEKSKKKLVEAKLNEDEGSKVKRQSERNERMDKSVPNGSSTELNIPLQQKRSQINVSSKSMYCDELMDPLVQKKLRNDTSVTTNVQQEADQLKGQGNKAMAKKEYDKAVEYYSRSLRLSPAGPHSHIYFSNRAAALCYLGRYEEAELDAERSLALNPKYGKAHARLGLSRYFLKDYYGAVDAYESALTHDPHNTASKSYLEKAKEKINKKYKKSWTVGTE